MLATYTADRLYVYKMPPLTQDIDCTEVRVSRRSGFSGAKRVFSVALYSVVNGKLQIVPGSVGRLKSTDRGEVSADVSCKLNKGTNYFLAWASDSGTDAYTSITVNRLPFNVHNVGTLTSTGDFPSEILVGESTKSSSDISLPLVVYLSNLGKRLM